MRNVPCFPLILCLAGFIGHAQVLMAGTPNLPNSIRIHLGILESPQYPMGEHWTLQVFDESGERIGFSENNIFGAGELDLRFDFQIPDHEAIDFQPGRYYFQLCTGDELDRQHKPVYCMGQWVDVDTETEIDLNLFAWQLVDAIEKFKVGEVATDPLGRVMGKLTGKGDGEAQVSLWSGNQFLHTAEIGDDGIFQIEEFEAATGESQLSFFVEGLYFDRLQVKLPDMFSAQTVVYVDKDAQGNATGKSWRDAYTAPRHAFDDWSSLYFKPEIQFAEGRYLMNLNTFSFQGDIQIYGGFAGNETLRCQRDPQRNVVVFSGDIADDDFQTNGVTYAASDIRGTNASILFALDRSSRRTVLDGFTVTGYHLSGGAISLAGDCDAVIRNVKFIGNEGRVGGAIHVEPGARPTIQSCWFQGNEAGSGGAIFLGDEQWIGGHTRTSSLTIHDCTFLENEATDTDGGAIFCEAAPGAKNCIIEFFTNITNCRFLGNKAEDRGAAICYSSTVNSPIRASVVNCMFSGNASTVGAVLSSSLTHRDGLVDIEIVNCTMNHNRGNYGETIYNDVGIHTDVPTRGSTISIENSILWSGKYVIPPHGEFYNQGQTAKINFKNNIIYGGVQNTAMIVNKYGASHSDLGGNLGHLPRFQDPKGTDGVYGTLDDNLQLKATSPGIDSGGYVDFSRYATATDLAGRPRWHNTVDRGAYEH